MSDGEETSAAATAHEVPPPPPAALHVAAKPRIYPVFVSLALVVCLQIGFGIVIVIVRVAMKREPTAPLNATELIANTIAAELVLLGAAVLLAAIGPSSLRQRLALGPTSWSRAEALAGYAGTAAAALVLGGIVEQIESSLGFKPVAVEMLQRALATTVGAQQALLVVAIGLVAPVCEELFFRGYAQTRLVQRFGAIGGIAITSVLFGAIHLDPAHAVVAAALGVVLGAARHVTGSLRPALFGHAVNNLIACMSERTGIAAVAVVVVVALGGAIVVARARTASPPPR